SLQLSQPLVSVGVLARSLDERGRLAEELGGYQEAVREPCRRAGLPFRQISREEPPIEPMLAFIKTPHWDRVDTEAKEAFGELVEAIGGGNEGGGPFPPARGGGGGDQTNMQSDTGGGSRGRGGGGGARAPPPAPPPVAA